VVTADEIAGVEIFAALTAAQREELARASADITLQAGEYAANQGDDQALFAVLDGHITPTRVVDGI
jgi:hypothetical protein